MNILKVKKDQVNRVKKYVALGASTALLGLAYSEPAFAAFDLDKGIQAGTDPLVAIITKYYGVGIATGGSIGALVGQGDLGTRAMSAGKGAAAAGIVILILLKAIS